MGLLDPDAGWDSEPEELFAIVSQHSYRIIWADFTTASRAQHVAVQAAINGGNCNLLSGNDLAHFILNSNTDTPTYIVHDGTGTFMDVRECRFVTTDEDEDLEMALGLE